MQFVSFLKTISQRHHHLVHLFFSGVFVLCCSALVGVKLPLLHFALLSLSGAMLPDLDHLLFIFGYGRNTNFAQKFRELLFQLKISKLIRYSQNNHKNNYGIYSHNLLSPIILAVLAIIFSSSYPYMSILSAALASHFVYDLLEDWLFKGRLNPNWFLDFKKNQKETASRQT